MKRLKDWQIRGLVRRAMRVDSVSRFNEISLAQAREDCRALEVLHCREVIRPRRKK